MPRAYLPLNRTPNSQIRWALRMLWLRSRERGSVLKKTGYCCEECKRKASQAKGKEFIVEVHHKAGRINWDKIISQVREELLCDPGDLEALCHECHDKKHGTKQRYA